MALKGFYSYDKKLKTWTSDKYDMLPGETTKNYFFADYPRIDKADLFTLTLKLYTDNQNTEELIQVSFKRSDIETVKTSTAKPKTKLKFQKVMPLRIQKIGR